MAAPAGQTTDCSLFATSASVSFLKAEAASISKRCQRSDHAGRYLLSSAFDPSPDNSSPWMLRVVLPICILPQLRPPLFWTLGVQLQLLPQFVSEAKPPASWSPSLSLTHTQHTHKHAYAVTSTTRLVSEKIAFQQIVHPQTQPAASNSDNLYSWAHSDVHVAKQGGITSQ